MFSEILPNVVTTVIVMLPLMIATTVLTEAALSFLSIGVQPPKASWGTIIDDGQALLYSRPWVAIAPGIMILLTVLWLIVLVAVLVAITVLVFLIFFATPGVDPTRSLAGRNPTPETIAAVRHQFGLDRSKPMQYLLMMKRLFVSRDLVSYGNQALKVVPAIASAAPVTFSLVFGAAVIWVVFSILVGLLAVVLKGTVFDPLLMILALIGISMPVFWLGEVMNLITQDRLHDTFLFSWVPPLGYVPLTQNPWQWFLHLVIPWFTLSVLYIGFYARVLRANLLDV